MSKWIPSRKWFAAFLVGAGGIATSAIESGWDQTESKLVVALIVQMGVAYLLPNETVQQIAPQPRKDTP